MYLPIVAVILGPLFLLGLFLRWRNKRKELKEEVRQLRAWMVHYHSSNHAFQLWKSGLSLQECGVLLELARGYCNSLNWELDWLLSSQIERAPALQSAVETGVNAYLESIFISLQKVQDVQAYQVYQAFEKKPTARKNRAMVEQLYEKLSKDGLIPQAKRLLGRIARRKANLNQQAAAVQHAFEHNPARTMELLKEVLFDEDIPDIELVQPLAAPPIQPTPPVLATIAAEPAA